MVGDRVAIHPVALFFKLRAAPVVGELRVALLRDCTAAERGQMITLMVLIFFALVFYTLYEQTYGSWVVFTDRILTKDFFPSLVLEQGLPLAYFVITTLLMPVAFMLSLLWQERAPTSKAPVALFLAACVATMLLIIGMVVLQKQSAGSLTFISGLFILSLAPTLSMLWAWLDKRGLNPSTATKTALGLLFGALSFVPLLLAARAAADTGTWASVWWLVAAYGVLQIGEICLYPVGLSAVTKLSVPRVVSLMMGTYFLATAFSEMLAAKLGTLASIEDSGAVVEHTAAWTSAAWLSSKRRSKRPTSPCQRSASPSTSSCPPRRAAPSACARSSTCLVRCRTRRWSGASSLACSTAAGSGPSPRPCVSWAWSAPSLFMGRTEWTNSPPRQRAGPPLSRAAR